MRKRDCQPARMLFAAALCGFAAAAPAVSADGPTPAAPAKLAPLRKIEEFAPPEEFIVAGGVKTHFVARGDAKGRPIVFIHGFGSSTYTWRLNLEPLAKQGFRAIAIDIKGFGLSEKPKDDRYDLEAFSDHLLAFLDVMKLEKPILVGNSMGGAIIARLALLHPDRVGGLILVDAVPPSLRFETPRPAGAKPAPARKMTDFEKRMAIIAARSLITRGMIEAGLKGAYHDPKFVTPEAIDVYHRVMSIEGAPEALVALSSGVEKMGAAPLPPLKTLNAPAMIVWGRHDHVIPLAVADDFARKMPGARKVVLENSGHMPHEEEADAFNALVVEFGKQLEPQRKP